MAESYVYALQVALNIREGYKCKDFILQMKSWRDLTRGFVKESGKNCSLNVKVF
jgi:hypothetical protein